MTPLLNSLCKRALCVLSIKRMSTQELHFHKLNSFCCFMRGICEGIRLLLSNGNVVVENSVPASLCWCHLWKWKSLSRVRLFVTHGLYSPWNSGQNTGVGSLFLLQGIFPTQGSNPGLPHCRWILYQLSQQGGSGATGICAERQPLPTAHCSCAMNRVKKRVLWRLNNFPPPPLWLIPGAC